MLLSFNLSTAISSAVFLFLVHKRGFDFHFGLSKSEVSAALYFICTQKTKQGVTGWIIYLEDKRKQVISSIIFLFLDSKESLFRV